MRILLTGKNGHVGFELHKKLSALGEVIATDREELDLANPDAINIDGDLTSDSELDEKSSKKKAKKTAEEKKVGYMFANLSQIIA